MRDKMPGDWLFKIVPIFIGVVFAIVIVYWICIAVLADKFIQSGCVPAVITETKDGQTSTSIGCKK